MEAAKSRKQVDELHHTPAIIRSTTPQDPVPTDGGGATEQTVAAAGVLSSRLLQSLIFRNRSPAFGYSSISTDSPLAISTASTPAACSATLGATSAQRLQLGRSCRARRFCLNGSFVTAKASPHDADAVVWLGADFSDLVERGHPDAVELAEILGMRPMEHLFAAEDRRDWDDWINFFSRTSGSATKKGLIEVLL